VSADEISGIFEHTRTNAKLGPEANGDGTTVGEFLGIEDGQVEHGLPGGFFEKTAGIVKKSLRYLSGGELAWVTNI
jgi:hypothetical protein